jgi:hypothetical protein
MRQSVNGIRYHQNFNTNATANEALSVRRDNCFSIYTMYLCRIVMRNPDLPMINIFEKFN